MKKQINLIIGIVVLLVVIVLVGVLSSNLKNENAPDESAQSTKNNSSQQGSSNSEYDAPDFTVYDEYGNAVNLSDYFGKPIVLSFWMSSSIDCIQGMPHFNNAYYKYQDVQFLMVNVTDGQDETLASAQSFIKGTSFGFPVFYDTSLNASKTYSVDSVPLTIFIDKNGELVTYLQGTMTADNLERGIAEIR